MCSTDLDKSFTASKRLEVKNQGYLIYNQDDKFRLKRGEEDLGPHQGYGDIYKKNLENEINRRTKFLKWIPWLSTTNAVISPYFV